MSARAVDLQLRSCVHRISCRSLESYLRWSEKARQFLLEQGCSAAQLVSRESKSFEEGTGYCDCDYAIRVCRNAVVREGMEVQGFQSRRILRGRHTLSVGDSNAPRTLAVEFETMALSYCQILVTVPALFEDWMQLKILPSKTA
jgi:hypothetical protein